MESKKEAVPGRVSRLSQLNSRLLREEKRPTEVVTDLYSDKLPSPPLLAVPLFSISTSLLQVKGGRALVEKYFSRNIISKQLPFSTRSNLNYVFTI